MITAFGFVVIITHPDGRPQLFSLSPTRGCCGPLSLDTAKPFLNGLGHRISDVTRNRAVMAGRHR